MRRHLRSAIPAAALVAVSALLGAARTAPAQPVAPAQPTARQQGQASPPAPANPAQSNPGQPNPGQPPGQAQAGTNAAPVPNPVLARVGDREIHQSDLAMAATGLPEQFRNLPPQVLYPMLLDQVIDREALVIAARKQGLENDPKVQEQFRLAQDRVLQNALLSREIGPTLTEAAVRARYDQEIAGKPGAEEAHAQHILVPTKEQAEKIIAELKGGADFAELAKKYSTDPAAANGGDLGWFKKDDMVPAFTDAAFGLKPGEFTQQPVQTQFGWHVIKLIDKRQAPPPPFEQVADQIRQTLIREGVAKAVTDAKKGLEIVRYNPDGSVAAPAPEATVPAPPSAAAPATQGGAAATPAIPPPSAR
jgi:peptidyl-prolyl cis-trans isomerase C